MGQQQLILLVLGVVIVGLAVVIGIEAFDESPRKSDLDRYTEMGVSISGDLIAFYHKPATQGGAGGDAARLGSVTVRDLGYPLDHTDFWEGFDRTGIVSGGVARYLAQSTTHPFFHIHKFPLQTGDTRVEVHVFGPRQDCIVTRTDIMNVSGSWSDGKSGGAAPANPNPATCSW